MTPSPVSTHRESRAARQELALSTPEIRVDTLMYLLDKALTDIHHVSPDQIHAVGERVRALRTSIDTLASEEPLRMPQAREILEARKNTFIAAYGIVRTPDGSLETNLRGTSREKFLLEADDLIRGLYGRNLLHRREFATWVAPLALDVPPTSDSRPLLVKPPSSELRNHVEVLIFPETSVADLLVANASHLVLMGTDLFQGKRALGIDGSVGLFNFGLSTFPNREEK
jgi:hypothetical protein